LVSDFVSVLLSLVLVDELELAADSEAEPELLGAAAPLLDP
jgi:hypothetical protein